MAYTDIIPLADAKNYLRIDSGFTDDDNQITSMINTSLRFVEKYTNHILFSRNETYDLIDGCIRVYDFPITSTPTDFNITTKPTYKIYESTANAETLSLTVGYAAASDIPDELIEFAYNLISFYYYQGKEGESSDNSKIPMWLKSSIDHYSRFIF